MLKRYRLALWLASCLLFHDALAHDPRVSIITSLYKGADFIEGFMEDIVQQTIFSSCEIIIINANSPDRDFEDAVIYPYVAQYENIQYITLPRDPGLYAIWNFAIKIAAAPYILNANVDDRLAPNACEVLSNALDDDVSIDLVYGYIYPSLIPNESFASCADRSCILWKILDFSIDNLQNRCLPGNHPMWRKTMHVTSGYFDESFKSAGDYEMWLRAVVHGAQFKCIHQPLGTYYHLNPEGLHNQGFADKEMEAIIIKYTPILWAHTVVRRIMNEESNMVYTHCKFIGPYTILTA